MLKLKTEDKKGIMNFKEIGINLIFKNTIWLGIAEAVSKLVGFVIVVWMARFFGPEIYGKWAFALSFTIIFSVFADFGLSTLAVREIARDKLKTKKYVVNIIAIKLILGILTFILVVFISQFLGRDKTTTILIQYLLIYVILNTFAGFFESIFRAYEKMKYEAFCRIVQSILLLFFAGFFIYNNFSITSVGLAYIGAVSFTVFLSFFIILFRFILPQKEKLSLNFSFQKKLLKESWPFGVSIVAIFLYNQFDQVMLGIMRTDREVGLYSAYFRIILALSVVGDIIAVSFFPQLSKIYKKNLKNFKKLSDSFLEIIYFFALPISLAGILLARQFVYFFFGKDYIDGILSFKVLIISVFFLFLSICFGEILKASNKQRTYLNGMIFGVFLNIALNLILIFKLGILGAAIATLLAQIVILAYFYIRVKKFIKINLYSGFFIALFSSIIMCILIYPLISTSHVIFISILGAGIYFLSYFLLKKFLSLKSLWIKK